MRWRKRRCSAVCRPPRKNVVELEIFSYISPMSMILALQGSDVTESQLGFFLFVFNKQLQFLSVLGVMSPHLVGCGDWNDFY